MHRKIYFDNEIFIKLKILRKLLLKHPHNTHTLFARIL